MFWLHHPQPVRPRKAVAEQMVVQKAVAPMSTTVIVIDSHPAQVLDVSELEEQGAPRSPIAQDQ